MNQVILQDLKNQLNYSIKTYTSEKHYFLYSFILAVMFNCTSLSSLPIYHIC